jgi:hypothetical protein
VAPHRPYPSTGSGSSAGTNGLATASLVVGIVGALTGVFSPVSGVAAAALGCAAFGQIRRSGGQQGGRRAVAGMVLGVLDVGLGVILLLVLLAPYTPT